MQASLEKTGNQMKNKIKMKVKKNLFEVEFASFSLFTLAISKRYQSGILTVFFIVLTTCLEESLD